MTSAPLLAPGHELLDHPDADSGMVVGSLHHISRSNWWFGGWWAVRRGLQRLLWDQAPGSTLTLLDIGTGKGDLPRRAATWARSRGITLIPIGVDRHPAAARLANREGVPTMVGCAGALPLRPGSVDLVIASQLIHHLAPEAIIEFIQAATRLARVGVVIADLRRSPLAVAGFWFGSRLLRFDAATRNDGITSIQRGFSRSELSSLLARAGVEARVELTAGFRVVATWRTRGSP